MNIKEKKTRPFKVKGGVFRKVLMRKYRKGVINMNLNDNYYKNEETD